MQRRRQSASSLSLLRWLLSCAIGALALGALMAVHVFSFSTVRSLSDAFKLPEKCEIGCRRWSGELRWAQEFAPPKLFKLPTFTQKLGGAKGVLQFKKLWKPPSRRDFVPCVTPSSSYLPPSDSKGYLLVYANGGLNQMRAGICDMVAVARLINATLVVPHLDKNSFWQDSRGISPTWFTASDLLLYGTHQYLVQDPLSSCTAVQAYVFDEEHFIHSLSSDVKIIKKLPKELKGTTKVIMQFRSWSGVEYYQDEISRLWDDYQVILAAKSDSRLANNNLPPDIQKLRCRAFYKALQFAPQIEALGKLLVERMRSYGPYIALHLRYEKDMLAFSGCTYGLSPAEADELARIRENISYWKVKDIDPQEQRTRGYCPLTPKEVGIFLSSLGYPSNTPVYIAAGEIYGGDSHMAELEARFPIIMSKEKLASADELKPFSHYASQMAALDYIVSVESDVFIPSYSGNMARAVEGHRRFLGHRKTITPDRKTLVRYFDKINQGALKEGKTLSDTILEIHKRRQGSPRKRRGPISGTKGVQRFRTEEPFYENPLPDCLCRRQESQDWNGSLANS